MTRALVVLALLLAAAPALSAPVVVCDLDDPIVPGRVLAYHAKDRGLADPQRPDLVIFAVDHDTVVATYGREPSRSHDRCQGSPLAVVPMTVGERAAIAVAEEAARTAAAREGAKAAFDAELLLRAVVELLTDEINVLRQRAGLAPRTTEQVRDALRTRLDQAQVAAQAARGAP